LRRCIEERLVGGEGFAVDASLIKADANRQRGIEGDKGLPPEAAGRAIDEYLAVLDDAVFGAATEVTPKCECWLGVLERAGDRLAWISEGANESWCSPTGGRPVWVSP